MGYFVQIGEEIHDYLASVEGLSNASRETIVVEVIIDLSWNSDTFLELFPLGHESLHFGYEYVQPDDNSLYIFEFIVDGTQMASGVVTVVFAECEIHRAT
jgi:hypothetical protein